MYLNHNIVLQYYFNTTFYQFILLYRDHTIAQYITVYYDDIFILYYDMLKHILLYYFVIVYNTTSSNIVIHFIMYMYIYIHIYIIIAFYNIIAFLLFHLRALPPARQLCQFSSNNCVHCVPSCASVFHNSCARSCRFFLGGRFLAVSRFTGVTSFLLNAENCKLIQSELPPIEGISLCNGVYCIQACSQVPGPKRVVIHQCHSECHNVLLTKMLHVAELLG